jgi:tetratricopeptide (TPR) repeat protein
VQNSPEVLAHHYTQANQLSRAIPLWQAAGQRALARTALAESISHFNKGLDSVATLPESTERDALELALRVPLGTAWLALGGWPTAEVWSSLYPALPLAKSLKRNDALLPILWGLMMNVMTRGRVTESFRWVKEMLDAANSTGDPDLLVVGHELAGVYNFFSGRLVETLEEQKQVAALYHDSMHRHLVDQLNHDPKTLTGVYAAVSTWMLGYPDQAVRMQEETIIHAQKLGHPFDLGFAMWLATDVFDCRCEPARLRKLAEACDQLGRENSLPVLTAILAGTANGVALVREGNAVEGARAIEASVSVWTASGGELHSSYANAVKAEALAQSGDLDGALQLIENQIEQVERPGWKEFVFYAEMLRLKGWIHSLRNEVEEAERNYLASLDWAREQQAKSWELRTSISLARLWQGLGQRQQAYEMVAPIYDWFTEGFDTKDLQDAKRLLDEFRNDPL